MRVLEELRQHALAKLQARHAKAYPSSATTDPPLAPTSEGANATRITFLAR